MIEKACEAATRLLTQAQRERSGDFTDITRMHRIHYLSQLKELTEKEPNSLRYKNVLKVKRNYVYDSW